MDLEKKEVEKMNLSKFISEQTAQSKTLVGVVIVLSIIFIILGRKIGKADATKKPSMLMVVLEMYYTGIENLFNSAFRGRVQWLMPYVAVLMVYILALNYVPIILPLEPATTDYSVTVSLAFITAIIIQVVAFRYNGLKGYLKEFIEPAPFMLPLHIFDIFARLLSMSMRLFCNILSGTIIIMILQEGSLALQTMLIPFDQINVLGGLITIPLKLFFDIFMGTIQAFVFTLLTIIFTSLSLNFEENGSKYLFKKK